MSVFGQIITKAQIQQAMLDTVKLWLPTYIAEVERQNGLAPQTIQLPPGDNSYITVDDGQLNKWPEHQVPAVLALTPGTASDPTNTSEGVNGTFAVNVAVVVSQRDQESTNNMAGYYAGAVLALVMQNQSLGGFAGGIKWRGVRWDELAPDDTRTIAAAVNVFEVQVENVVETGSHGLSEPPADPYTPFDFQTPESVTVEVEQETP